jgi:hypothetical protein
MVIASWYNSGSMEAFSRFCYQNKNKRVSLRLMDRSEQVIGVLHSHNTEPASAGLSLLLNKAVIHPAYYCLEDIESLHEVDGGIKDNIAIEHSPRGGLEGER